MFHVVPNGTSVVNLQRDKLAPTIKKNFLIARNSSTVKYSQFPLTEAG